MIRVIRLDDQMTAMIEDDNKYLYLNEGDCRKSIQKQVSNIWELAAEAVHQFRRGYYRID